MHSCEGWLFYDLYSLESETIQAGVCPKHLLERNVDVSIPFNPRVHTCPGTEFTLLSDDCSCVGHMIDHKAHS